MHHNALTYVKEGMVELRFITAIKVALPKDAAGPRIVEIATHATPLRLSTDTALAAFALKAISGRSRRTSWRERCVIQRLRAWRTRAEPSNNSSANCPEGGERASLTLRFKFRCPRATPLPP